MVVKSIKAKKYKEIKKKSKPNPYPKQYYQGLSKKDKEKQLKELQESRNSYKKGEFISRSQKKSFKSKKSAHVVEFEKKYGININDKKAILKNTGVTIKAQNQILKKGMGAFYSSGSRPNQSAQSWAYARLASVLLKHNAYPVDRHILIENKCDNIKKPNKQNKGKNYQKKLKSNKKQNGGFKRTKKSLNKKKSSKRIISCCKINDKNEKKYKKCIRDNDGSVFSLPRKYSRNSCKTQHGFTMRSSCAIYKDC